MVSKSASVCVCADLYMTERSYPRMGMTDIMLNMPRKVVQE